MNKENIAFIIAGTLAVTALVGILYAILDDSFNISDYEWSSDSENSKTVNYDSKDVSNERFRAAILDVVNDYRAVRNLQPMKLGDSVNAQKQSEETARTNDDSIQIGDHDTIFRWVVYFPERNNCIPILSPCSFNPRIEGIKDLDDWLNYEWHPDDYIDQSPGDGTVPFTPEAFLAPGTQLLHVGVAVRDEFPMSAFYEIQLEIPQDSLKYQKSFDEGKLKDGSEHGKGTYHYPNGDVYEGELKDGLEHGKGTYTWANGTVYEGNFINGEISY